MSLASVAGVGLAIDVTREYLRGRTVRGYLLLAGLALLLGPAGSAAPPGPVEVREEHLGLEPGTVPTLGEAAAAIGGDRVVLGLAVAALLLAVAYVLFGALAEFAVLHSLVHDTVAVREPVRRHRRGGLELAAFRLLAGALVAGAVVGVSLALWEVDLGIEPSPGVAVGLAILALAVLVVHRFTTDFAVPIMLAEGVGLLGAWARLSQAVGRRPREFAVYLPVRVALEVAGGIALGIAVAIVLVGVGLVVGLPVFAVGTLLGGPVVAAVVAAAAVLPPAAVAVAAVVLPLHVYLRYYALLVLGAEGGPLDLVADWRDRATADPAGRL